MSVTVSLSGCLSLESMSGCLSLESMSGCLSLESMSGVCHCVSVRVSVT